MWVVISHALNIDFHLALSCGKCPKSFFQILQISKNWGNRGDRSKSKKGPKAPPTIMLALTSPTLAPCLHILQIPLFSICIDFGKGFMTLHRKN